MLAFAVDLQKNGEDWQGVIHIPLDVIAYSVEHQTGGGKVSRAIDPEDIRGQQLELKKIKIRGRKVNFKVSQGPTVGYFMGKLSKEGDEIKGVLRIGRQSFPFLLVPRG